MLMRDAALSLNILLCAAAAGAAPARKTAVLAGGCFWGREAVFEHTKT